MAKRDDRSTLIEGAGAIGAAASDLWWTVKLRALADRADREAWRRDKLTRVLRGLAREDDRR